MTSAARPQPVAGTIKPEVYRLTDDGRIPNNPTLPLLVYRAALLLGGTDPADDCETLFARNGWCGGWRNGIYAHHHYHPNVHEVLGIARGAARVRFGGERGPLLALDAGDVIVVPAGVGHKNEGASVDLIVVGAYPDGAVPELCSDVNDRPRALERIRMVPLPAADPVYGRQGPLFEAWRGRAALATARSLHVRRPSTTSTSGSRLS